MRPWDPFISSEEQQLYLRGGFGKIPAIKGRAALAIVDVQYRMMGTRPMPLAEAIAEFPTSCGEAGWRALPSIRRLRDEFRARRWPIVYVALGRKTSFKRADEGVSGGTGLGLAPSSITPRGTGGGPSGYDIVAEVAPEPDDTLIWKYGPSAFFGTPLASLLVDRNIQTLVVAGSSTSGCVRATAVDGFSHGFNVLVPEEAVFDRSSTSHAVSLFDMATRYAAVAPCQQIVTLISTNRGD